jgi:CNT family concentrative nucleoside transporter
LAASIAAILILIVGLVDLINQIFASLATVSDIFKIINLPNIQGALFYPLTLLTGVSLDDSWTASVIIGRRLLETAIPPYQALAQAAKDGLISDRTVIIVSYALSGFAHLASVGIFVGGTIALIPSRRRDISDLGWKALFVGTLATLMIACIAGVFDDGSPSILGEKKKPDPVQTKPAATASPSAVPTIPPSASPSKSPTSLTNPSSASPSALPTFSPKASPSLR